MGCILVPLYRNGKEHLETKWKSLHDIQVKDIDGNLCDPLGEISRDKKCIMVVNVASK